MIQIPTARENFPHDAVDQPQAEDDALALALRRFHEERAHRVTHPEAPPTVRYECTSWSSGGLGS